jgi:hypothetical protein
MPFDALERIRQSNREVEALIAAANEGKVSPELLAAVSGVIRQTQGVVAADESLEMKQEVDGYRKALNQLYGVLCRLQTRLLIERARLDRDRNHSFAASQWIKARQTTL